MKRMIIKKMQKKVSSFGSELYALICREGMEDFVLKFKYNIDVNFLDDEYADSFVVSLLSYAMEFGYDIIVESPLSVSIYNKLNDIFIPCLSKYISYFHKVKIECSNIKEKIIRNNYAVATGCSCGVDSLHAIYKNHKDHIMSTKKPLTHLVVVNSGACSWEGGEVSRKWFNVEVERAKKVCYDLNLSLIYVDTNLMEFYNVDHRHSGFMRISGIIIGMAKLIEVYYYASSFEIKDFHISDDSDDGPYLPLTVNSISDNNLEFKITGLCEDRYEKVKLIQDYDIAHKYINICWNGAYNCGKCEKCLRTIGALYTLNKLDSFCATLNYSWFKNHKIIGISKMILYKNEHKEMYTFLSDLRKTHKLLYLISFLNCYLILYPLYKVKKMIKSIFRRKRRCN